MEALFENGGKYIAGVIRPLLPNAHLGQFVMNNYDLLSYGQLEGSKYHFPFYEDSFFLHFTSFSSFLEIIRSKTIRISDLNSFDDPFELTHANSNLISDPDKFLTQFQELKSGLFAFSMCEFTEENLKNEYMWKNYGRDHKGVCIKLKLDKSKSHFDVFQLGKVLYTNKNLIDDLIDLKNRHESFKGIKISNLHEIIAIASSMYKKSYPFSKENEIRLIASIKKFKNTPLSNADYPIRHKFKEEGSLIQNFFELELEYEESFPYGLPHLSIDSIYTGKNLYGGILGDLSKIARYEFKDTFGRELLIDPLY